MKNYIFFNPLSGNGSCENKMEALEAYGERVYIDLTKETDFKNRLLSLESDDKIIICGGDGTLNRFINSLQGMDIKNDILYFATGSGNDFLNDLRVKPDIQPIKINDYIASLPILTVDNKEYRFINGIGFGLDGYACAECNRLRTDKNKSVSYVSVAAKGILHAYSPVNARVTVDGREYRYDRVWMASCMKGRYFGGGVKIAPDQNRLSGEGEITSIIVHSLSRFRILTIFPSIFKGTHVRYTKYIAIKKGQTVTVEFDRPVALQIDGETVSKVTSYSVTVPQRVLSAER